MFQRLICLLLLVTTVNSLAPEADAARRRRRGRSRAGVIARYQRAVRARQQQYRQYMLNYQKLMLQRQQAQAVVAARTRIVDGAVGMVEMALERLARDQVVDLDEEKRASMVSNLLVVLCSDRHTQPVVNAGTLYS